MYLHLGNDIVVNMKDIIAVLDMDNTTISRASRGFLSSAQEKNLVVNTTDELPKSYIITNYKNQTKVYISSISPATLYKRAKTSNIVLQDVFMD